MARRRAPLGVLLAAAPAALALWIARDADVHLVHALPAVGAAARAIAAAALLFAVCGLGLTRLLLPEGLRSTELLWVLPVGACAAAIGMTALGYAAVPFELALALLVAAGLALAVWAIRRAGPPARPELGLAWPAYVAALLACVALVPLFRGGFATVIGDGSDAHLAAGTAELLRDSHPTGVNPDGPVDRVPLVWRSKPPIYYALGSVATLAGLETWETLSSLAALMLALAAVGIFLVARHLLAAGLAAAVLAAALTGLDRMVLHTGMHPYFNQTWGYFTLPFALVLSWWAVRHRSRGGLALLALFLAVGAFAYPLALPFPLLALAVSWWLDRRARRARGEPVSSLSPRRLYRGPRSLAWLVPLALLLSVPALGVLEKSWSAAEVVLNPSYSLRGWGGDLLAFIPDRHFFALGWESAGALGFLALVGFAVAALRPRPRELAWGLGAILIFGLLAARYFRERDFGWYFHFKTLAFVGPLVVACAAVGMGRLRRLGPPLLAAFLASAVQGARGELAVTTNQLPRTVLELRGWARGLPADATVRLDMPPGAQLWVAYMMSSRPLCSERPLLATSYPHVPVSRRADYVLVRRGRPRPRDAAGPPLRRNFEFRLYRARPRIPGPDRCSRRMVQTVKRV